MKDVNPWIPMSDPIDLKHIGKLGEEVNELGAAISRCVIQGIHEAHPETGKVNKEWLEDEIADVLANIDLCVNRFKLNVDHGRVKRKKDMLKIWHAMDDVDKFIKLCDEVEDMLRK